MSFPPALLGSILGDELDQAKIDKPVLMLYDDQITRCAALLADECREPLIGSRLILQKEEQRRRCRSSPPAFGNHFQLTACQLFQPVERNATVIFRVLMKRVTEGCGQMEIPAVC